MTRRVHRWVDDSGALSFEHIKDAQGRWFYRHPAQQVTPIDPRSAPRLWYCAEHEKSLTRRWCPKKPAAADGLLWRMPQVLEVLGAGGDILWCAGEKDAEAVNEYLGAAGVPPAAAVGTSSHHGEEHGVYDGELERFAGFLGRVFIYFDADPAGVRWAIERCEALLGLGIEPEIRALHSKIIFDGEPNDVSDWLAAGRRLDELRDVKLSDLRKALGRKSPAQRSPRSETSDDAGRAPAPPDRGEVAARLRAFVTALKAARPETARVRRGDRTYYTCPLADAEHQRGDMRPSFSVGAGRSGALVLQCSCAPGGREEHRAWVSRVLEALGLSWGAVAAPGRGLSGAEAPGGEAVLWNDADHARLLVSLHGEDLRYVPEDDAWVVWAGDRWRVSAGRANDMALDVMRTRLEEAARAAEEEKKEAAAAVAGGGGVPREGAAEALRKAAVRLGDDARVKAIMRQAALAEGMSRPASLFDAGETLLGARNGTIELSPRGAFLREHRREDYLMARVPFEYRADAHSDEWDGFLKRFVPDQECRSYLQALVGYSLLGRNTKRKMIFVIGPTSTGKTTFINVLQAALGGSLAGTFQLSMLRTKRDDAPRPDLLKALTRRMIFAEEASSEWHLHADLIKALTANGRVEARGMRTNLFVERVPAFTPWLATNGIPEIRHADTATKKRLIGFPFRAPVTRDDEFWAQNLEARDYEAVLAWAVAGWDLCLLGDLDEMPLAVERETRRLRESLSPVDGFLLECCAVVPHRAGSASRALYHAYREWCSDAGVSRSDLLSEKAFCLQLTDRGHDAKKSDGLMLRPLRVLDPQGGFTAGNS